MQNNSEINVQLLKDAFALGMRVAEVKLRPVNQPVFSIKEIQEESTVLENLEAKMLLDGTVWNHSQLPSEDLVVLVNSI